MRKNASLVENKNLLTTPLYIGFLSLLLSACSNNVSEERTIIEKGDTKYWPEHFRFGQPASKEKIAAIDIDIRPDGAGLPEGLGTASEGRKVYAAKCASCHGNNGVEGPYNHLVGTDTSKAKAIGNYWPYATTVFDYIRRAMPFNSPGSLSNKEVYNVTAYLLYANKLIDSSTVVNKQSLPKIEMPAKKLFIPDDRQDGKEIR